MQIVSGHVWLFSSYLNKDLLTLIYLWKQSCDWRFMWQNLSLEEIKDTDKDDSFQARWQDFKIPRSKLNPFDWERLEMIRSRTGLISLPQRDVWKGNQLMQIPGMRSPWDNHLSSSAALLAALALIYCSSEWAAFVYYVMFSVWVEAEVPHHRGAKTLSTQIMFILGSSRDFTVVGQILY